MIKKESRKILKKRKKIRIRKKIRGGVSVPRVSVFKSLKHIYAQIIDDENGRTLIAVSTLSPKVREKIKENKMRKLEKAKIVGNILAEVAKEKGIDFVVFDRSGYKYHGVVRSLAEGIREGGLKF